MSRSAFTRMSVGVCVVLVAAFSVGAMTDHPSSTFAQTGRNISPSDAFASGGSGVAGRASNLDDPAAASSALQELPSDDRIIRTAAISLEVAEGAFDAAWERVFAIADRIGGRVQSTERRSRDGAEEGPSFGTLTLRVPAARFEEALVAVRDIGEVRLDNTSSEDVTEEFVDLESRLRHMRAQETALLRLMARAESVSDTLKVQGELSKVQSEIERVTGRLNLLGARTEFSTITLSVGEPGAFDRVVSPAGQRDEPSFAQAWDTAIEGLERMATAGLILLMWSLPFAVGFAIGFMIWRSRRPAPQV